MMQEREALTRDAGAGAQDLAGQAAFAFVPAAGQLAVDRRSRATDRLGGYAVDPRRRGVGRQARRPD